VSGRKKYVVKFGRLSSETIELESIYCTQIFAVERKYILGKINFVWVLDIRRNFGIFFKYLAVG
jgi:hypothetical protein